MVDVQAAHPQISYAANSDAEASSIHESCTCRATSNYASCRRFRSSARTRTLHTFRFVPYPSWTSFPRSLARSVPVCSVQFRRQDHAQDCFRLSSTVSSAFQRQTLRSTVLCTCARRGNGRTRTFPSHGSDLAHVGSHPPRTIARGGTSLELRGETRESSTVTSRVGSRGTDTDRSGFEASGMSD